MSADSADRITFKLLTESYSRHLNCEVCGKLMIDPRRLHPCADTFCLHCIDKNLKKCPKCHLVIRAVQIDMTAAGLIDQLNVQCISEGCPWKGPFEEYKKFHYEQCQLKEGGIQQWLKNMREKIDEKLPLSCTLSESENDDDPLASIKGSDLKPQSLQAKLKLVEEVEDSLLVKELKKAC